MTNVLLGGNSKDELIVRSRFKPVVLVDSGMLSPEGLVVWPNSEPHDCCTLGVDNIPIACVMGLISNSLTAGPNQWYYPKVVS